MPSLLLQWCWTTWGLQAQGGKGMTACMDYLGMRISIQTSYSISQLLCWLVVMG